MKKILFLTLIFCAIMSTATYAQPAGDPPSQLQQMKDKIRPQMVEKTGLTDAQADKIIELNYDMRMAMAAAKDLPEDERKVKFAELKAAKEKKMKELFTEEQLAAVKKFYEEQPKPTPPKTGN